jgi:hypothetical protein
MLYCNVQVVDVNEISRIPPQRDIRKAQCWDPPMWDVTITERAQYTLASSMGRIEYMDPVRGGQRRTNPRDTSVVFGVRKRETGFVSFTFCRAMYLRNWIVRYIPYHDTFYAQNVLWGPTTSRACSSSTIQLTLYVVFVFYIYAWKHQHVRNQTSEFDTTTYNLWSTVYRRSSSSLSTS